VKKVLPIGKDDFRIIRENENYYVDKTLMIRDFIEYGDAVALITRPRRFGKTLNMTMLRDFFDITQKSENIFLGLSIMDTKYIKQMNSVPVIYLTLKGCIGESVEEMKEAIAEEILKEYVKHESNFCEVQDTVFIYSRYFETLEMLKERKLDKVLLNHSLSYLIEALYTFYKVRPIVLIDEYDNPIIEAHGKGFRESFRDFYATFLTTALKGNPYLGQALLTGIQRVAKESIFSKINNVTVYNVLDEQYAKYFGLMEEETSVLLNYYELALNDSVRSLYDGYLFSGIEIYNPWSILSYAQKRKLRSYWIKTSTNALVNESILSADYEFHEDFERLIKNGEVTVKVNLEASFTELPRTETLWGLFVNAGYLTVVYEDFEFGTLTVKIPNNEVLGEFRNIVGQYTRLSSQRLQNMLIALTNVELDDFLEIYQKLVLESTSYYDSKENAYHMLMLGMVMNLRDIYKITSNIESGYGRSDIVMESKDAKRPHIIIEFKQGEDIEKLKNEALQQILDKQYYIGLQGEVLCIGIAHDIKRCELVHKMLLRSEY